MVEAPSLNEKLLFAVSALALSASPRGSRVKTAALASLACIAICSRRLRSWLLRRLLLGVEDVVASLLTPVGVERFGQKYLEGYFQPLPTDLVNKLRTGLLPLEGQLPKDLRGAYLRNGPNQSLPPRGGYHAFGGDGMIHACRLAGDGTVSYHCDFVRTPKRLVEAEMGESVYAQLGDLVSGRPGILGLVRLMMDNLRQLTGAVPRLPENEGNMNTALVHHNHQVYALVESSLPFKISISPSGVLSSPSAVVASHGYETFGGKIKHAMTAHPKVDPTTGELIFFSYDVRSPSVWHGVIDREGNMSSYFKFPVPHAVMIHDMFVTENWTALFDSPAKFMPERTVSHGEVFCFDKSAPNTLLLLPRHATDASQVWRIPLEKPFYSFHTIAAWEHEGQLTLFFVRTEELSLANFDVFKPKLWRFDVRLPGANGESPVLLREEQLSKDEQRVEFPAVNPAFFLKTRWAWISAYAEDMEGFSSVQKWDLEKGEMVNELAFGDGVVAGEAVFAARDGGTDEEDGYLVTLLHDKTTWQTSLAAYDAKTLERVSMTPMPHPIPAGFHGTWLPERDLLALRS